MQIVYKFIILTKLSTKILGGNRMLNKKELTIEEVAKQLNDGLDQESFEEIITGLQLIMMDEGLTLQELNEKCWGNSTEIFDKIYG